MGCGPGAQRWVEGCVWGGKNCRSKAVGGRFEVSFREGSLSGPDQYGMIECWGWVRGKRNAVCFSYPLQYRTMELMETILLIGSVERLLLRRGAALI